MIPYTESTLLFENKNNKDNSKIIIFEKSGHVSSLVDEYDKYMNSAKEFLNK
jgi:esterase/lipase